MRLLIGSDAPTSLGPQADIRAWTERLLWFAKDGDALVFMDTPDPLFVKHVTCITGVDHTSLHFHILPSRWVRGNFDAWSLLDNDFQDELEVHAHRATEVLALWPTPEIAWLVNSLEVGHKWLGSEFFREGGGILANSKAVFRALAAGAGVAVAPGGVCRSLDDAFHLSGYLLQLGTAFMVKRSYGGSGMGNEIVSTKPIATSHAGHASSQLIEANAASLRAYWAQRWVWASADESHPVVIEAFVPNARTFYAEVLCDTDGVRLAMVGELRFIAGCLTHEIFPAQDIALTMQESLQEGAKRLAQSYWAMGYRGYLSLDSVVTPEGDILFTEANARFTSSTHLYTVIAPIAARALKGKSWVVVQMTSPASWQVQGLEHLLETLTKHQLLFHPSSCTGLMVVAPFVPNMKQVVMAAVAEHEAAALELFETLGRILTPKDLARNLS